SWESPSHRLPRRGIASFSHWMIYWRGPGAEAQASAEHLSIFRTSAGHASIYCTRVLLHERRVPALNDHSENLGGQWERLVEVEAFGPVGRHGVEAKQLLHDALRD